jgi:hypothetical protein
VEGKGKIQFGDDGTFSNLNKPALSYGFLDDLYVNTEFVRGILETKNFSIKDALYQILNGMSGAAGGMWDFQIQEQNADGGDTELVIVDMNLAPTTDGTPYKFDVAGSHSVFMDASLDMDISGAKMNQIIGNRLGQKVNGSKPQVNSKKKKGLFTDLEDLVLKSIEKKQGEAVTDSSTEVTKTASEKKAEEDEAKKKAKLAAAAEKGGVNVDGGETVQEVEEIEEVLNLETLMEAVKDLSKKKAEDKKKKEAEAKKKKEAEDKKKKEAEAKKKAAAAKKK